MYGWVVPNKVSYGFAENQEVTDIAFMGLNCINRLVYF